MSSVATLIWQCSPTPDLCDVSWSNTAAKPLQAVSGHGLL